MPVAFSDLYAAFDQNKFLRVVQRNDIFKIFITFPNMEKGKWPLQ